MISMVMLMTGSDSNHSLSTDDATANTPRSSAATGIGIQQILFSLNVQLF